MLYAELHAKRGIFRGAHRRVPKAVQPGFGPHFVRVLLGRDQDNAEMLASKLTKKLDEIWASPSVQSIDVSHLLRSITPKVIMFDDAVDTYGTLNRYLPWQRNAKASTRPDG